jgi:hypothetical protein
MHINKSGSTNFVGNNATLVVKKMISLAGVFNSSEKEPEIEIN